MDPAAVRTQLAQALEPVLPGRVSPHPPTSKRYVTPSIFIEQVTVSPVDENVVGSFPVWILADGAIQAQIETHDDLVWNAYLALWPIADRIEARPQQMAGLRATVVDVDVELATVTLAGLEPDGQTQALTHTLAG
jgi:hypothetical protein